MAKEFLSSKGVRFQAVDVSASPEVTAAFVTRTGARATPVIEIDGEIVVGWNQGRVEQLLHEQGTGTGTAPRAGQRLGVLRPDVH